MVSKPVHNLNAENIYVILVRPKHPGNIGASCRAMKNMGLRHLRLVAPPNPRLEEAGWLAAGAQDILASLELFSTLEEALADIVTVVGTTCRTRHWKYPVLPVRDLGPYLLPRADKNKVAILFGPEDFGLHNSDTNQCEMLVRIPTVDLDSLNLSQAVLIVGYELMMSAEAGLEIETRSLASFAHRERLVAGLMNLARQVEFRKGRNQLELEGFMTGLSGRLALDATEIKVLLGFIRKTLWHLNAASKDQEEC